jgi:hypothetical protein
MTELCILVEEPLSFARLDNHLADSICVQGSNYEKRPTSDDDLVFYDWIIDESDVVRGLEIHLPSGHPLLQSCVPLNEISQVETNCFVRLWFGTNRTGTPQGKEAFGDIFFFGAESNKLAIVVGLDSWLSLSQGKFLLASFGLDGQ